MDNMSPDDNRKQDFEGLVFANKKKLWNLCSSFTLGAAWETDDAFQEVLCALWRNWDQLKREDRRHAWMFRVAYHTLLNIKRSNNIPTVPFTMPHQRIHGWRSLHRRLRPLFLPDALLLEPQRSNLHHCRLERFFLCRDSLYVGHLYPSRT